MMGKAATIMMIIIMQFHPTDKKGQRNQAAAKRLYLILLQTIFRPGTPDADLSIFKLGVSCETQRVAYMNAQRCIHKRKAAAGYTFADALNCTY